MKYLVEYRKGDAGEIEAVVEASDEEEAARKFLAGKVEKVTVNFWVLWSDLVEVSPLEEGGEE